MTAVELLERAIEEKRDRPHVQGRLWGRGDGGVCMMGALLLASGKPYDSTPWWHDNDDLARQAGFAGQGGQAVSALCTFNNTHTKEECIEEFERKLVVARERELAVA